MADLTCDVLVVGAGPAGSCAAREAAGAGADVVVIERKAVVGAPVRCAEYIPAPLTGEAGVGGDHAVQHVTGMRTWLNGKLIQELPAPGHMIRRDRFDQALAEAAMQAGARYMMRTSAVAFDGRTLAARTDSGGRLEITAGVVVGADGPWSRMGRHIGSPNTELVPAVQVRVRLARPLWCTEVFFDDRIRGGYAWLFPKGEEANLGLGMLPAPGGPGIRTMLAAMLGELTGRGFVRGVPLAFCGGWIPAERPRRVVRGRVLLAGDAAGHTHPVTGAGVLQAVLGGRLAGKWAARAAGDSARLGRYQEEWDELYGETLAHAYARRRLLLRHAGRLDQVIRRAWIGFREYYGTT